MRRTGFCMHKLVLHLHPHASTFQWEQHHPYRTQKGTECHRYNHVYPTGLIFIISSTRSTPSFAHCIPLDTKHHPPVHSSAASQCSPHALLLPLPSAVPSCNARITLAKTIAGPHSQMGRFTLRTGATTPTETVSSKLITYVSTRSRPPPTANRVALAATRYRFRKERPSGPKSKTAHMIRYSYSSHEM